MTIEKIATISATATATVLTIAKLVIGIASGSVALLASAIDSLLDMVISLFNVYAIHNSQLPADATFNYGRGKIEALAAVIEGSLITLSGLFIIYQGIAKFFTGEAIEMLEYSIYVMLFSIVVTLILVVFLDYVARKTDNLVIKSDSLHYKTDLWSNLAVLISLGLIYLTDMDFIDSIVGISIGIYIIYSAYGILKEGSLILLDVASDPEIKDKIVEIIKFQKEVTDFHYLKTRSAGNINFVDVHIVFNPSMTLLEAHRITDEIEDNITKINAKKQWTINIHMDPYDDSI
jgi:cation diffusion facilitator family transporter